MPRASLSGTPSRAFPGGRRGMTGCGCVGVVCRTAAQVVPSVRSRPVSIVSCNREPGEEEVFLDPGRQFLAVRA